jgi:hypothetical protein
VALGRVERLQQHVAALARRICEGDDGRGGRLVTAVTWSSTRTGPSGDPPTFAEQFRRIRVSGPRFRPPEGMPKLRSVRCLRQSGREDLNLRPLGPEATEMPTPKSLKAVGRQNLIPFPSLLQGAAKRRKE